MLFIEQVLNGFQLGVLLFLVAAGLTLVFGIMNVINLAHGSLYMVGAFLLATFSQLSHSFFLGLLLTLPCCFLLGLVLEQLVIKRLYQRDHLDQVLATFGIILFSNELVRLLWGATGLNIAMPPALAGGIELLPGLTYSSYRLAVIATGASVALGLYVLINKTRLGMLIRAGASNKETIYALGINIHLLYSLVFAFGAMLAGLAGAIAAPMLSVEIGMGEEILILTLVVIVIGGMGSIKGTVIAALLLGQIDTLGRAYLPQMLNQLMPDHFAATLASSLSSTLIYFAMILILVFKPQGLFPAQGNQR